MFYIDATTSETISVGLAAIAKAANTGETPKDALAWLMSSEERWLLVLNNADDPKLNLQQFFPTCSHGDILITTRNQQMRAHTQETKAYCSVAGMIPDDALALMLKASGAEGEESEINIAHTLVKVYSSASVMLGVLLSPCCRILAFSRSQSCNVAHICVQLIADLLSIMVSSKLREHSY